MERETACIARLLPSSGYRHLSARPRCLFITPIHPARRGLGLAMRMGSICEALAPRTDLSVLIVPVAGTVPTAGEQLPEALGAQVHEIALPEVPETAYAMAMSLADDEIRLQTFHAYGKPSIAAWITPSVREAVQAQITAMEPDLLVIGRSYLAGLAWLAPKGTRIVLDADEDDETVFAAIARLARNPGTALWARAEGAACSRLLRHAAPRLSGIVAASDHDAAILRGRIPEVPVSVVTNAVPDVARWSPPQRAQPLRNLLFVGALAHEPNIDAALWLIRNILPCIRGYVPGVRLTIAGARPDARLRAFQGRPGISIVADPYEVASLYARASVVVAPLRAGGGTKLKIIEAIAHGVPIVATSKAVQGISPPAGFVRVANDTATFAKACASVLSRPDAKRNVVGRKWVMLHYDRQRIATRMARVLLRFHDSPGTRKF